MKVRYIKYRDNFLSGPEVDWNEESRMIRELYESNWEFEVDGIIHNWNVKDYEYHHSASKVSSPLYRGYLITDNNTNSVLCDTLWNEWDKVLKHLRFKYDWDNYIWDLHAKEEIALNMRGRMNGEDGLCVNEKFRDSITVLDFVNKFKYIFGFCDFKWDFDPYFRFFKRKKKIYKKKLSEDIIEYGKEYTWTY